MDLERLLASAPESEKPLVLIVDDQPEDVAILKGILEEQCVILCASGGKEALDLVRSHPVDLIFLAVVLPDLDGFMVCEQLKSEPALQAIPVIFIALRAGVHDEEQAFGLGAVDYIYKPLIPAIVRTRVRIHLGLHQALAKLATLASTDHLTSAWNRRHFERVAAIEIARSRRYRQPLSLLFFDIDHFKLVNDHYGHQIGDGVLSELARLVQGSIRYSDTLTRWGGEEFTVLAPSTCLGEALVMAEALRARIESRHFSEVKQVTISLGVAEYQGGEELEDWLRRADQALLNAKGQGRNRVECHPATAYWYPGNHASEYQPLVQLVWRDTYKCGHPLVDAQHQELFRLSNELLAVVIGGLSAERIHTAIRRLLEHTLQHFSDEEILQRECSYPDWEIHCQLHKALVQRALTLERDFLAGNLEVARLFGFLAYDVVARHMLHADCDFYPYLARAASS